MNIFEESWLLIKAMDPEQDPFAPAGVRRKARKARRERELPEAKARREIEATELFEQDNKKAIRQYLDDHKNAHIEQRDMKKPKGAQRDSITGERRYMPVMDSEREAFGEHMDELHNVLMDNLSDGEINEYGQMIQKEGYYGYYEERSLPDETEQERADRGRWTMGRGRARQYEYDDFQHDGTRYGYGEEHYPDDLRGWRAIVEMHNPWNPSEVVKDRVLKARPVRSKDRFEEDRKRLEAMGFPLPEDDPTFGMTSWDSDTGERIDWEPEVGGEPQEWPGYGSKQYEWSI